MKLAIIAMTSSLLLCETATRISPPQENPPVCNDAHIGATWQYRAPDGAIVQSCECKDPSVEPGTFPTSWVTTDRRHAIGGADWCPSYQP